ncbi:MAG: low molecular weight phosphotyrosine protein phosphatase [Woeseiaceae bacterium]|nr:low molecular weight phosphotyrosine protein phosphatase [Woeseiaceae bacterium]
MSSGTAEVSVLFVCMGNICRSPTAEGVFRQLVDDAGLGGRVHADSAGTHAYHTGNSPDHRAAEAAERRGYSLAGMHARRVNSMDFETFDFIVAMDDENLMNLRDMAEPEHHNKIQLFLEFSESAELREVPDPYYGGSSGFERVLDLVENASQALLASVKEKL